MLILILHARTFQHRMLFMQQCIFEMYKRQSNWILESMHSNTRKFVFYSKNTQMEVYVSALIIQIEEAKDHLQLIFHDEENILWSNNNKIRRIFARIAWKTSTFNEIPHLCLFMDDFKIINFMRQRHSKNQKACSSNTNCVGKRSMTDFFLLCWEKKITQSNTVCVCVCVSKVNGWEWNYNVYSSNTPAVADRYMHGMPVDISMNKTGIILAFFWIFAYFDQSQCFGSTWAFWCRI